MNSTKTCSGLASWILPMLLLFSIGGVTPAAETLLPPQQVIQHTSDQLQTSLQKPEYRQDFKKATDLVDGVLNSHVDFDRVSMLILGKYWKTASPAQKDRFKDEFRFLLVRTYTTAFTEYSNWKIRHLPLQMQPGDKRVLVRTEIVQPGAQPVAVDYRMVLTGNDWKVYDVMIEGISLLQNYRTSFMNEIAQTSIDHLIDRIAERNRTAMKEPLTSASGGHSTGS